MGYSNFIDKHKSLFLIGFFFSILVVFIPPIMFNARLFDNDANLAMEYSMYSYAISPILMLININKSFQSQKAFMGSLSYEEFIKDFFIPYYIWHLVVALIFWFTIISLIIVLTQHFKHKKVCKPLLYLPLAFYIVYTIIICAISTFAFVPFVGFYLAIILEVLVILYCANFQHFPKFPKPEPRFHKPSDRERIAELEKQVEELRKEKDAE